MNTKPMARAAAAAAALATAAALAVGCSLAKQARSVVSSAASAGPNAATSVASAAPGAVSGPSVLVGAATTTDVPGVGDVTLDAATAAKYQQLGGEAVLGPPTRLPRKVGNGTSQAFANGTIFYSPSTDAHLVRGEILRVYLTKGGPAGALGFPTNDEHLEAGGPDIPKGGWRSDFEHGSISWLNQGNGTFKETVTQQ